MHTIAARLAELTKVGRRRKRSLGNRTGRRVLESDDALGEAAGEKTQMLLGERGHTPRMTALLLALLAIEPGSCDAQGAILELKMNETDALMRSPNRAAAEAAELERLGERSALCVPESHAPLGGSNNNSFMET
eukprot:Amastigsp_a3057_288.p2 type:complete len:134 gc:universal Amastigsp_a3057_288:188-589(+)